MQHMCLLYSSHNYFNPRFPHGLQSECCYESADLSFPVEYGSLRIRKPRLHFKQIKASASKSRRVWVPQEILTHRARHVQRSSVRTRPILACISSNAVAQLADTIKVTLAMVIISRAAQTVIYHGHCYHDHQRHTRPVSIAISHLGNSDLREVRREKMHSGEGVEDTIFARE